MGKETLNEFIDKLNRSCHGRGVSFEDIEMPDDLRQAIIDYYQGRGFPVKILEKYYPHESLRIKASKTDRSLCYG